MRLLLLSLTNFLLVTSCHKQLAGPRKLTLIGEINYSYKSDFLSTEVYPEGDDRIFKIKLERDYDLSGDIKGTWQESGAQVLLHVDGDFGPKEQFPIDHGFYDNRSDITIEGHSVDMTLFAPKTYFCVVTFGYIGSDAYYRYLVFK